jgi:hypothetical protein
MTSIGTADLSYLKLGLEPEVAKLSRDPDRVVAAPSQPKTAALSCRCRVLVATASKPQIFFSRKWKFLLVVRIAVSTGKR